MIRPGLRSTLPLHYILDRIRSTCSCCGTVRELDQLYSAHSADATTAVALVPLTANSSFLWSLPLHHRLRDVTTMFCSKPGCLESAFRKPLPPALDSRKATHSNFTPAPAKEATKARHVPTLEDVL